MTLEEIKATLLVHWRTTHRKATQGLTEDRLERAVEAQAALVMAEIEALELIGVDRRTAWSDVKMAMLNAGPPEIAD